MKSTSSLALLASFESPRQLHGYLLFWLTTNSRDKRAGEEVELAGEHKSIQITKS